MKSILLAVIMTKAMLGCSGPKAMEYKSPKLGPYYMTQIDKVYDGDTFYGWGETFIYTTTYMKIRVMGMDTPEIRGSSDCEKILAYKAKEYLISLLNNSMYVIIDNIKYDSFGRVLAFVTVSQGRVDKLMIKNGFARPYIKNDKSEWCSTG